MDDCQSESRHDLPPGSRRLLWKRPLCGANSPISKAFHGFGTPAHGTWARKSTCYSTATSARQVLPSFSAMTSVQTTSGRNRGERASTRYLLVDRRRSHLLNAYFSSRSERAEANAVRLGKLRCTASTTTSRAFLYLF